MVKYSIVAIVIIIGFIVAEYDKRKWYTPRDFEYFLTVFLWWAVPIICIIGVVIEFIVNIFRRMF